MEHSITILDIDRAGLEKEMVRAQVHVGGIKIMMPKAEFRVVKLKDVSVTSANIIKQDMLAFGGEAATSRGTIDHSAKKTDVLIFGTIQQIISLIAKLKKQYFGLKDIGAGIEEALKNFGSTPRPMKLGKKTLDLSKRTYIMGILNVTPDSFSDGGRYINITDAVEHGRMMMYEGADIIDVGGESTRPGAAAVNEKEEIARVVPVIKELAKVKGAIISIDTMKSGVAAAAIKAGAKIINDVSALNHDKKMVKVAARTGAGVVLMHMAGNPRTMQKNPSYGDLIPEIISHLQKAVTLAIKGGVPKNNLIVDPGFGFGKTVQQNLEILRRLKEFKVLGCPVLMGTSRKSTIGAVLDQPPDRRLEGTAATVAASIMAGASIVRVHDVAEMKKVAKMCDAIIRG